MPLVRKWLEAWCKGKVLNLFAGKVKLSATEMRNDIDKCMPADYHMDAMDFIEMAIKHRWQFDTIILDPPYSMRKSREKYQGRCIGSFTRIKNEISKILKKGGRVITFGYSSTGMSASRGFKKVALCLICHKGDFDDTMAVVEDACTVTKQKDLIAVIETKEE